MITETDLTAASAASPLVQMGESEAARYFDSLNHIEHVATDMIERLPSMTDDVLLMARGYAKQLGSAALRVECAADAELIKRAHAPVGRGHKDVAGIGVEATLAHIAQEAHTSKTTLRANAQIYNLILSDDELAAELTHLEEREFYAQACRAVDPKDAIRQLARRKANDPGYTTRQARADVDTMMGVRARAVATHTEPDWRAEVDALLGKVLILLPEACLPSYVQAIERTKKVVWRCNPADGASTKMGDEF